MVDALLAPTSPHEVGRAAAVDSSSSMSIYLQMKVGRDVGFTHMRPQQNPKKNDDAERVHNFAPTTNLTKAKAASRLFELVTAGTSLLFFCTNNKSDQG